MKDTIDITRAHTNLDLLMLDHGIKSDKELAKRLGLTPNTLSFRLRGSISMDTLKRLATLFKVSVKDLLRDL